MLALHDKLIESGHIDRDPAPVYRFKKWPWIIVMVILLLLAVLGVIAVVKGNVFKSS